MWRVALAFLSAAGAQAEQWTGWDNCSAGVTSLWNKADVLEGGEEVTSQTQEGVSMRFSSGQRGLGEALNIEDLRLAHQLVFLNNYTGKLEVNHDAVVWKELMSIHDEVNVIVMYGYYGRGRSTLASMLGCAMNNASETTTVFPAQKITESVVPGGNIGFPHTIGIWASDPFVFSGPDGEGPPRTFMIVDTQGLDHKHQVIEGVSRKIMNDAAVKVIAMLTEIASEFIYVSSDRHAILGATEYDNLGLAFKTTRANLVKSSEEWQTDADKELNIRSINHPGLLFVTRENIETDIIKADEFAYNDAVWDSFAVNNYESRQTDLKTLIDHNFEPHTVNTGGADKAIGWLYNPFPEMDQMLNGDNTFAWAEKDAPYPLEQGATCAVYRAMSSPEWTCKTVDGNNDATPTAPPTFKLMIDNLANEIYAHAPVRQVAWGNELSGEAVAPQNLTGARLKGFMEASVTEINKAGAVADNELWRLIMNDRCAIDLDTKVNAHYTAKLRELDDLAKPAREFELNEDQIANLNATFIATWIVTIEQFDTVVADFFLAEALLESVKEECTTFARTTMETFDQRAHTLFAEMKYLGEQQTNLRLEGELATVKQQLEDALQIIEDSWWQMNLPYIIAFVALGIGAVYVVARMFSTARGTCQACCACCVDLQTKDVDQKVTHITRTADGQVISRNAGGAGLVPPSMHAPLGESDPQLHTRIEELEEVVLQLAQRVPKRDLPAGVAVAVPARTPVEAFEIGDTV